MEVSDLKFVLTLFSACCGHSRLFHSKYTVALSMNWVWGEWRGGKGGDSHLRQYLFTIFSGPIVFQVYKCSQSSQTRSRKVVLAATVRLKTGIF